MFEMLDDLKNTGIFMGILASIIFIFVSGIFFGLTYFLMDTTNTALLSTNCTIEGNTLVPTCQDLFAFSIYPFLALKEILIWASFFFIFGLVLAMLVLGYQSGKSPVLMGILITFVGGITYLGIELSNVYRDMLDNAVFRSIMTPFTVYNKVMIYFPYFCFFVGLFAVILSLVNYQKTLVNKSSDATELDY